MDSYLGHHGPLYREEKARVVNKKFKKLPLDGYRNDSNLK